MFVCMYVFMCMQKETFTHMYVCTHIYAYTEKVEVRCNSVAQ